MGGAMAAPMIPPAAAPQFLAEHGWEGAEILPLAGDAERDRIIISEGYRILRFWNHDVLGNPDGVASVIADALPRPHPLPASPIEGEGKRRRP